MESATSNLAQSPAKRLLVIDDSPEMGALISHIARGQGYVCDYARTFSAFQFLLSTDPDVIVVDMIMPEKDGVEVLRYLSERGCGSAILLLSQADRRVLKIIEDMARAMNLHVMGSLHKPFSHAQFEIILRGHERTITRAQRAKPGPPAISVEDFRVALSQKQFVVHYQPKVAIQLGEIIGIEAFVRWEHPVHGLIYPDAFLGLAETAGCFDDLTWLIVDQVFADARVFATQGWLPMLAINVSAKLLNDIHLSDTLLAKAAPANIAPERIVVEIADSGQLQKAARTLDILTRLRLRGIKLSIKDFGTGFSMMQQIKRIPASEMKIDKEFIRTMTSDHSATVIVRKTIEIGHELGMAVVAEGVETREQLATLSALNCDMAQGYFFSRALPAADIARWRRSRLRSSGKDAFTDKV